VPLAVLALAAPAAAEGGRHATTYKAKLAPVAAAPEATAAERDGDAAAGVRGKAELVDGPRRDRVQPHVGGLTAGAGYSWSVRQAAGEGDACTGEVVDAFSYDALDARRRGHGRERARSRDFAAEDGTSYAVVVTAADGTDVACGEFASRSSRRRSKAQRKADEHGGGKKGGKRVEDDDSDDEDSPSADEDSADEDSADEDSDEA
jgi:hypothetical protein